MPVAEPRLFRERHFGFTLNTRATLGEVLDILPCKVVTFLSVSKHSSFQLEGNHSKMLMMCDYNVTSDGPSKINWL